MKNISKAEHIVILSSLIGILIMVIEHHTHDKRVLWFLSIPIIMMLIAKRIIKKNTN